MMESGGMSNLLLQWYLFLGLTVVDAMNLSFTSQPGVHNSTVGESVILPCRINSPTSDYAVMWQKMTGHERQSSETLFLDRTQIAENDRLELVTSDDPCNFDLKITRLVNSDAGNYDCAVSVASLHPLHVLHVRSPPTVNTIPEKSPVVIEVGSNFHLTCFTSGNPKPTITWTKLNGSLPENVKLSKNNENSIDLDFQTATEGNAGNYRCTADNGIGTPASTDIAVQTISRSSDSYAPKVSVSPKTVDVSPAEPFNITCTYSASPPPIVEWFFGGYKVEADNSRIRIAVNLLDGSHASSTLMVKETTEDDYGDYICQVDNSVGKTEATVSVTGFPDQPRLQIEPNQNNSLLLHWSVDSATPILAYRINYREYGQSNQTTITINADSKAPTNAKTYKGQYDVEKLRPETSYEFMIQARNQRGWGKPALETFTTGKLQTPRKKADPLLFSEGSIGGSSRSSVNVSPILTSIAYVSICTCIELFPVL